MKRYELSISNSVNIKNKYMELYWLKLIILMERYTKSKKSVFGKFFESDIYSEFKLKMEILAHDIGIEYKERYVKTSEMHQSIFETKKDINNKERLYDYDIVIHGLNKIDIENGFDFELYFQIMIADLVEKTLHKYLGNSLLNVQIIDVSKGKVSISIGSKCLVEERNKVLVIDLEDFENPSFIESYVWNLCKEFEPFSSNQTFELGNTNDNLKCHIIGNELVVYKYLSVCKLRIDNTMRFYKAKSVIVVGKNHMDIIEFELLHKHILNQNLIEFVRCKLKE